MEGAYLLHAVFMSAIAIVVGRVTVHEAVGQDEVDGGVVPVERRRRGRLGALKQQQAIAAEGGLQSDFAAADGRDIAAVKIADLAALGEGFANVDGQRFSIPLRTLADLRRRGAGLFFLQRNHHRRRAGAGIHLQGIQTLAEDAPLRRRAATGFHGEHLVELNAAGRLPALLVKI